MYGDKEALCTTEMQPQHSLRRIASKDILRTRRYFVFLQDIQCETLAGTAILGMNIQGNLIARLIQAG